MSEDIRYGNDLTLTEIDRAIHAELKSLSAHLRDGYLDSAFLRARAIQKKCDAFMERLNEIKPMPKLPDGYRFPSNLPIGGKG